MFWNKSFCNLPVAVSGVLLGAVLLFFWLAVFLFVRQSQKKRAYGKRAAIFGGILFLYIFLQILLYAREISITEIKTYHVLLMIILLLIAFSVAGLDELRWSKTHISGWSIKESFDVLPSGILVYAKNGMSILVNRKMDMLSRELTGKTLLNGRHFRDALSGPYLKTEDGQVFTFDEREISLDGVAYTELRLNDVTELYRTNEQLSEANRNLRAVNARLKRLNRTIDKVTMESEILNAKVHVHDELGQALLATKQYLSAGDTDTKGDAHSPTGNDGAAADDDTERLIALWKESMGFMKRIAEERGKSEKRDEYETIFGTADDIGMRISLDGKLPEGEVEKHITATALHECMTNALRHAGADELFTAVSTDESRHCTTISIRNNGTPPKDKIRETGGLATLRQMVESAGGAMRVESDGEFLLVIRLP